MTPEQLKLSILQYAMQGKLVEQRLEEGTGSLLLQKIKDEKERLIKLKYVKKEKKLPDITEDDIPFDVPDTWTWAYIGDIFMHNTGKAQNSSSLATGHMRKFITTSNLYWNKFDFSKVKEMTFTDKELERCTVKKGDLLVCEGGDCGRSAIWNFDEEVCIQNHVHRLRPYMTVDINYFYYLFYLYKFTGRLRGRGVAIQGLSNRAIHQIICPLPCLEEQHRIVAKIEELLPLIDKYNSSWTKLEKLNIEFPEKMKKSILQYAIQGKLVEQKLEEGTAEELYKKIQEEKNKLIQEGKIKKQKELAEIKENEIPFDIPDTWKWVKLGTLIFIERGASPRPIKSYLTKNTDGVNWIKIGDSEAGAKYITTTSEKITYEGAKKSRKVEIGDFIISNSMSFGRPYIMAIDGYVHDGWNILHFISDNDGNDLIYKDYIYYLLSSSLLKQQIVAKAAGGVVKNIKTDNLKELIIPLPPYKEQKRISKKIEEMLRYCN